jgi:hypothetical protein
MADYRRSPLEFTVEELDRELVARGSQVPEEKKYKFKDREGTPERNAVITGVQELYKAPSPPNEVLAHISTWDLAKILIFKTRSAMDFTRGAWSDDLMDWYELIDEPIIKNAGCTAALCLQDSLSTAKNGFSTLKVKNYGDVFNLCDLEPFSEQPVSPGFLCSGFLVKEDVIATTAHKVNENNVTDLRIVFGFQMVDSVTPVTRFANETIYRGVEIIHRVHHPGGNGADWALVKLDRPVEGQAAAVLSKDEIVSDQAVYVFGHPLGLPLKYGAGASVHDVQETSFRADFNMYSGSSGAPVFDLHSHEVIGMIVKGENRDFRWTGKCWITVNYPQGKSVQCTRISDLIDFL